MASETDFTTLTAWAQDQDPRPQDVRLLKQEIRTNLLGVTTSHGGGVLGHVAIMMTPAEYLLISNNIPFPAPAHPGHAPVYGANASQYIIQEAIRQYNLRMAEFNMYHKVQKLIKKQILEAVPKRFTETLEHHEYAYDNVTAYALINHLATTYGKVTRAALETNLRELDNEWSPDTRFSTLISHQRKIQQFAADNDPISDNTLLMKGLAAVRQTGLFTTDMDLFDRRPAAEQTYHNFKEAFTVADTLYNTKITTAKAGYHTANAATKIKQVTTPQGDKKKLTGNPAGVWYCWSHGIMHTAMFNPAAAHSSDECKWPAKGHVNESTFINMCGGNNSVRRIQGETPVYEYVPRDKTARKKRKTNGDDKKETPKKEEA